MASKSRECLHATCKNRLDELSIEFFCVRFPSPESLKLLYDKAVGDRNKYCDPKVNPNYLEPKSFTNAKTIMNFLHKITLKNEEGVPTLLEEYRPSSYNAWGDNRVKWWHNTGRVEPLGWMCLGSDLRLCSQHFEVGDYIFS